MAMRFIVIGSTSTSVPRHIHIMGTSGSGIQRCGGRPSLERSALALLTMASLLGCGASAPTAATGPVEQSSTEPAASDTVCPLPQMDERRFALHGGPTGCDSDEVECNRECMRGDARHCHVLGLGHRLRPINHELGTELLLRGCQLGLPESCVEWVLAVGRASDVDQCQRPVMERACALDVALGCTVAGAYATDAGEHDEAREFALRACDLGDYDTCARLADTTDAAAPDGIETLRRLLFAACFRGEHLRSCVRLAEALEDGPFATDTANEAGVAWEQACRLDRRYCSRVPPPRPPPVGTDAGSASLYAEPSAPAGATAPTTGERGGSLSADVIRTVVRANQRHVQACYETALARWSALRGTVTVRFIIQPDGTVSTATVVSDTVGDAGLRACITASVVTWRFPAPDGGGLVSVTYPFTLEST